jgi:hypothetical protein
VDDLGFDPSKLDDGRVSRSELAERRGERGRPGAGPSEDPVRYFLPFAAAAPDFDVASALAPAAVAAGDFFAVALGFLGSRLLLF